MIIAFLMLLSNGLRAQNNQPSQREPGAVPEARIYHSLVYHIKTDNILVFAGLTKRGWIGDLRDIWKYDPNTEQWKYVGICEAVSDDGKSVITTMAYDQESDQFISVDHNGSTWAYNFKKNRWKNMNPLTSPSGRAGQGMAYDKESDQNNNVRRIWW